ncbi:MAG: 50S ribosomal protein L15, partial [Lachnospiraceae bacterium]|nr:50S ribosomal protein L15 [Lachnospiraceae bacterium]
FEGGQMPLYRRLPKRGFHNYNSKEIIAINVSDLERCYEDGEYVTAKSLLSRRAVSKLGDGIKILGDGEITKKLTVRLKGGKKNNGRDWLPYSASAKEKIEAAGGKIEVL